MPDFRRVTDNFYVAPQIEEADVPAAAAAGFRTIVNNRPDGEQADQMPGAVAEAAAQGAGLAYFPIPVLGPPSAAAVAALEKVLDAAEGPVLAYCRSGTRSVTLWALASVKAGKVSPAAAIEAARGAGYDLSGLAPALQALKG